MLRRFFETCVSQRGFVGCSPAGALLSRCFCCGDGPRALARTNVIGTAAICGSIKAGRAAAHVARNFCQPLAAVAGAMGSTRVALLALGCAIEAVLERYFGLVAMTYSMLGVFFIPRSQA